jgi:hypothetical protein
MPDACRVAMVAETGRHRPRLLANWCNHQRPRGENGVEKTGTAGVNM